MLINLVSLMKLSNRMASLNSWLWLMIGVKVLIDSRALFSIIGSTMDFVEDRLSARFVFDNPHVKGSCGCGESFSVS